MKKTGSRITASMATMAAPAVITSAVAGITISVRRKPAARSRSERLLAVLYRQPAPSSTRTARRERQQEENRADFADSLQALKRGTVELASTLAETARTDLPPIMRVAGDRAAVLASELGTKGQVVASDLSERMQYDVAPVAKTLGKDALVGAEDLFDTVRERAYDLAETAREEYIPRVSAKTMKLSRVVVPSSAGTMETLTRRARRSLGLSRPSTTERVRQQLSTSVSGMVQQAGSQTKHAAGETAMIAAWGTGLGLVVYYGVLTAEQRDRVNNFLSGVYEQAREAVRDFGDRESEF